MASSGDPAGHRRLHERANATREKAVRRALDRLEARTDGDVSPRQRAAIEAMAEAVVEELLAEPEHALRGGDATMRARIAALFDLDVDAVEGPGGRGADGT